MITLSEESIGLQSKNHGFCFARKSERQTRKESIYLCCNLLNIDRDSEVVFNALGQVLGNEETVTPFLISNLSQSQFW